MRVRGLWAVVAVWGAAQPAAGAPPAFDAAAVDKEVEAARAEWGVPGVAVVVVRGGEVLHCKGYGERRLGAKGEPVTADTLFPLGSCTKAFTATAIAALIDDGRMGWDDPVRKHLPHFRLSDEAANKMVSVRDLLCHRTGLASHDLLWYGAAWGTDEMVRRLAELPLDGPFRGGYAYCTPAVVAAGEAAANRTGGSWEELVTDKLTKPLGMTAVAFTTPQAAKFADRASGHRAGKGGKPEATAEYEMKEANPAGSMFCTPNSFAKWLLFQVNDGKVGKEQVVSARELGETKEPHTPIRLGGATGRQHPGVTHMSYALGWVTYTYRGEPVVAHAGLIDGFRVLAVLLPGRKAAFAVFANRHQTRLNPALGNTLIDRLAGLPAKDWNAEFRKVEAADEADRAAAKAEREKAREKDKPADAADKLAGTYTHPAYGEAKLVLGDAPEWRFSSFRVPLEHWGGNVWRATARPFEDELLEVAVTDGGTAARFGGIVFRRK